MTTPLKFFIIGGHGKVALSLTSQALARGHSVVSQIRQKAHISDLPEGTQPLVESIEETEQARLMQLLDEHQPNVVVFAAGAGGKGGEERTWAVDRDAAIRVFDALEHSKLASSASFRRLLVVSAIDVRGADKSAPEWYGDKDFETAKRMRDVLGTYMAAKHAADVSLSTRTSFPWLVLRPSRLLDDPGTARVSLAAHTTISEPVRREDVAHTLLQLAELEKGKGDGQMWNLTQGETEIGAAVKEAAERNRTDWVG
ncbi:NAD(P)-binding protein [Tilletiopsis washingtonensis]|uniref:NAD(P)-binding protein n=1 Tax=Tilletiopsis washingtonensis TaxID=58919 RepID=A0A316ZEH1_9BASI|nr:NAD(P)-binding protein [Tilletiopsis washingtonensis]PWN99939.1 NAD(P)-binding protein [Tilletiopsis washingtonensis]